MKLTKRKLRKSLDEELQKFKMSAQAMKVIIETTPDILSLSDDSIFREREPPYDEEKDDDIWCDHCDRKIHIGEEFECGLLIYCLDCSLEVAGGESD
jgi:hypothetical protein